MGKYFLTLFVFLCGTCWAADKTIVVTCATGELGSAIAARLAQENNLILLGRDQTKLKKLKESLEASYPFHYETVALDYSDSSSLRNFKEFLDKSRITLSGIVILTPRPQFQKDLLQDESVWMQAFQNTFIAPLEVLKGALPHLGFASKVVIIAGTTSVQVQPQYGPFCVIRRMWTTYVKALSHQLGPKGITINAISPDVVLTNFHKERIQKKANENNLSYEEQMVKEVAHIPLGRHAEPEEIAKAVQFFLSENAEFINGVNLIIDGGSSVCY